MVKVVSAKPGIKPSVNPKAVLRLKLLEMVKDQSFSPKKLNKSVKVDKKEDK